jgi:hypothetical protein
MNWRAVSFVLVATLAGGACVANRAYESGQRAEREKWQQRWSERDAADATAVARQQAANRAEEQRRQQEIARITQNAQQQINAARADADSAAAAGNRLQQTVADLQRRLRQRGASGNTATAGACEAERAAADMFAELFRESDATAGAYAAEADRRRIEGLACEQSYEALRIPGEGVSPP